MSSTRLASAFLLSTLWAAPAFADTTVKVELWDRGGMMDMSGKVNWGMGGHRNPAMAMMGIKVDKATVPAGKVSFEVKNTSRETIHEMIVAPIASRDVTLPFVAKENRIDEDAAGDLGEVSELDPGKSGVLSIDLKPGLYVLFCNVPGHFMAGMWTVIEAK